MRTTLIPRDELINRAAELTGIRGKTALVHLGLESLIAQENRRRLAALGGTRSFDASLRESHVHDVFITKEAPNYELGE